MSLDLLDFGWREGRKYIPSWRAGGKGELIGLEHTVNLLRCGAGAEWMLSTTEESSQKFWVAFRAVSRTPRDTTILEAEPIRRRSQNYDETEALCRR